MSDVPGMTSHIIEKLSAEIGVDRIIPLDDFDNGQFAYIDTEDSSIYLVTVQEAKVVVNTDREARP